MDFLLHNTVQLKKDLQSSQQMLNSTVFKLDETRQVLDETRNELKKEKAVNGLPISQLFDMLNVKPHVPCQPFLATIKNDTVCSNLFVIKEQQFFSSNYEERIKILLSRMKVGEIYPINENKAIS